jgi:1-pyrroline-5-carboxylate dehydrogenase
VFNLVCGANAGKRLVATEGVDGIAFTGSHAIGMEIMRVMTSGPYVRPVMAEMGGKNPAYVSKSAELDVAVRRRRQIGVGMQGQKCTACSVAYVHASLYDAFLDKLVARAKAGRVGDPTQRDVSNGPLINAAALARYEEGVAHARAAGPDYPPGGNRLKGELFDRGSYVGPRSSSICRRTTIFSIARSSCRWWPFEVRSTGRGDRSR